jgi:hypothetical protein
VTAVTEADIATAINDAINSNAVTVLIDPASSISLSTALPALSAGTLQLGNGTANGRFSGGSLAVYGTLDFKQGTATTIDTAFGGTGAIMQDGPGALTLDGVSTDSGRLSVANGAALAIGDSNTPGASFAGSASVSYGGTLSGFGSIGSTVTNNGTVAPGAAGVLGTLRAGSYVQNAGGNLLIAVTPSESSVLAVSGPVVVLNGTVTFAYAPGTYTAHTYNFVTANSSIITTFNEGFSSIVETGSVPTNLPSSVDLRVNNSIISASLELGGGSSTTTPLGDSGGTISDSGSTITIGGVLSETQSFTPVGITIGAFQVYSLAADEGIFSAQN